MSASTWTFTVEVLIAVSPDIISNLCVIISDCVDLFIFFSQPSLKVSLDLYQSKVPASSPCHRLSLSSKVYDCLSVAHCNLHFIYLGLGDGSCLTFLDGNPISFSQCVTARSHTSTPVSAHLRLISFVVYFLHFQAY